MRGFFQDVLDRIELEPVRDALGEALEARIPQACRAGHLSAFGAQSKGEPTCSVAGLLFAVVFTSAAVVQRWGRPRCARTAGALTSCSRRSSCP